jgi:hypothetical protein
MSQRALTASGAPSALGIKKVLLLLMTLCGGVTAKAVRPGIGSAQLLDDLVAIAREEGTRIIFIARADDVPSNLPATVDAMRGATVDSQASLWVQDFDAHVHNHPFYTEAENVNDYRLAVIAKGDTDWNEATPLDQDFYQLVEGPAITADSFTVTPGPRNQSSFLQEDAFRVVVMDERHALPAHTPRMAPIRGVQPAYRDPAARFHLSPTPLQTAYQGAFEQASALGEASLVFSTRAICGLRDEAVNYYINKGFTVVTFNYLGGHEHYSDELTMVAPASHREKFKELASLHDESMTLWEPEQEPALQPPHASSSATLSIIAGTGALALLMGVAGVCMAGRRRTGAVDQGSGDGRRANRQRTRRQAPPGGALGKARQALSSEPSRTGAQLPAAISATPSPKEIAHDVCTEIRNRTDGMDKHGVKAYLQTQVLPAITLAHAAKDDSGDSIAEATARACGLLEAFLINNRLPGWFGELDFQLTAFLQQVHAAREHHPDNAALHKAAAMLEALMLHAGRSQLPDEKPQADTAGTLGTQPTGASPADAQAVTTAMAPNHSEMKTPRRASIDMSAIWAHALSRSQQLGPSGQPLSERRGSDVYIPSFDNVPHLHVKRNMVLFKKRDGHYYELVRGGGELQLRHLESALGHVAGDSDYDASTREFLEHMREQSSAAL